MPIRTFGTVTRLTCVVTLFLLAACATAAQRQAQQASTMTREAATQLKSCISAVVDKPEYAALLPHTPDLDSGQHTMAQLTNETVPSVQDARLFAARFDEVNPCRKRFLSALAAVRPDLVPILADGYAKGDAVAALLVERKITWAESAKRAEENTNSLRKQLAAADQQWIAELKAENQAELAQRQAAAAALMQWSQQQQMINAINRPVTTNCNRFGSTVNCTSY